MMTTEEKLKDLILNRYKSIREFSIEYDIPYTTIKSMLTRGISNSSVGNVIKLCTALKISVDALANGTIEPKSYVSENQIRDVNDIINDAKSRLTHADTLTINGNQIDIEMVEPIIEALDIGYEMVKRKNTKNTTTKTITKS